MTTELTEQTAVRNSILGLQAYMQDGLAVQAFQSADCPLTHHFAPGAYGREIFMPAGSLVIGKIHKHAHLNCLLQGIVSVMTEQGPETFSAPRVWVSHPGTKRVVYNHTDVRWMTVHVTDQTDLEKIEDEIIAPTYADYEIFKLMRTHREALP